MVNSEVLTIKSDQLSPIAKAFIRKQKVGEELEIKVIYTDLLKKEKSIGGFYFL
jgi:hypothetical protein